MAGIGFNLRKILLQDNFFSTFSAYLYSSIVSSGPWIFTIISIALLNQLIKPYVSYEEATFIRSIIIYMFALSLMVTSPFLLVITRAFSDMIYARDNTQFLSIFISSILNMYCIALPFGLFFFVYMFDLPPFVEYSILLCFLLICQLWLHMEFINTIKDYISIFYAFVFGMAIALLSAYLFGKYFGFEGIIPGFSLGLITLVCFLSFTLIQNFKGTFSYMDLRLILKRYPRLFFMGLFYNTGIWMDKIIIWYSHLGEKVYKWIYTYYFYDGVVFYAYLSIIPSLAYFTLILETDFYDRYKHYYHLILNKATYTQIEAARVDMLSNLWSNSIKLFRLQLIIVLLMFFFAPQILSFLGLDFLQIPLFRYAVLGSMFHIYLLICLIVLSYFDFYFDTFILSGLFLIFNAGFTKITLFLPQKYLGLGYLCSTYLVFILAFLALVYRLKNLNYFTFCHQDV